MSLSCGLKRSARSFMWGGKHTKVYGRLNFSQNPLILYIVRNLFNWCGIVSRSLLLFWLGGKGNFLGWGEVSGLSRLSRKT